MSTVYVTHSSYAQHTLSQHPEHTGRIISVWQTLIEGNLINRMQQNEPVEATDEMILAVHEATYLQQLKAISQQQRIVLLDADTYVLPQSLQIARLAAGGVVTAIEQVLNGQARNGLAAVRPPGHHALPQRGMGFCLFGNIAIGARYAQKAHDIQRILIVDYDVHHGNGTQDMFYDDPNVLFISTHQHPFYPGSGHIDEIGRGGGEGYTINIPLAAGHGDRSYQEIYERIIWPAAQRFQPELMLVSAGFDAHWRDPLAQMMLSLQGYAHITRELVQMAETLCEGRIVFVMEGGYDLEVLGHGVRNIAHALLGDETVSDPIGNSSRSEPSVESVIEAVCQQHQLC